MIEYGYEDIIMDPEDPRLEGAIGKVCYFGDYPKKLLNSARNDSSKYLSCLTNINKECIFPFVSKNGSGWTLIIIKKEEPKPRCIPFENQEEFLNHYTYHKDRLAESSLVHQLSSLGGIWLGDKYSNAFFMVTEIWDEGVVIGDSKLRTISNGDNEYFTMNDVIGWRELYEDYTFLDGSPCGKEVEE